MRRWRPRLSAVLILINFVVLVLPLGGIAVLRIYESALIRQTESELIAQGVIIGTVFESMLQREALEHRGVRVPLQDYGVPVSAQSRPEIYEPTRWRPRLAVLDLAIDPVHERAPDPAPSANPPDPLASAVGRALSQILRDAQVTTLAGIRVVDYRGVIVASTARDLGRSLDNHEEVRLALAGEHVSRMRRRGEESPIPPLDSISRGTRLRVYVAVPVLRDGRVLGAVLLVRTPANIKQAIYGKRVPLMKGGLLLLGVAVLLALVSSRLIARPVQAVIVQARRAARGERGAVVPLRHAGTREIAELSDTVAQMAQTLEQRAEYIRDFSAHVSHEFKTPLTAIQGAVEILRDHGGEMSDGERERFLGMLGDDAARLEALVRRLLELARADMMRPGDACADLAAVLRGVVARHRETGLSLDWQTPLIEAAVAMAPEVLDSILGNLLDNARQHAGEAVHVDLLAERRERTVRLRITDNGPGISAANAARVFEPFFTTARDRGNTGLGLPIIRALIEAHGGQIRMRPSQGGACFELELPLNSPPNR